MFNESLSRMTREALKHAQQSVAGFPDVAGRRYKKRDAAPSQTIQPVCDHLGVRVISVKHCGKNRVYLGLDVIRTELTSLRFTEGMIAAMMATVDHGDEVVVFEPYYEN